MAEESKIQKKEVKEIDLTVLFQKLYAHRKKLYKAAGIGLLAGLVIGFSLPKTYQVDVSLSPESGMNGTSGLSGIASMFGLGNGSSGFGEDALTFNMFPEIVKTNPFALEMLQIPIQTQKEKQILLYDYLDTEKRPWWIYIAQAPGMVLSLFKEKEADTVRTIDPFHLTPAQTGHIERLKKVLKVETDKKTNTIMGTDSRVVKFSISDIR